MLFANNCNTTLSSSLTNVATTMSVTSATGFPSPTGSQYFYCTLADAATQTTIEIVKVTAVSGTTFTIVRGQDGTSGTAFASGAVVSLRLVSASLNDFPKLDENNIFTSGFYSTGSYSGSFTDGIVADYVTGVGRFSVGTSDGFQWFNAGVGTTSLMFLSSAGKLGVGTTTPQAVVSATSADNATSLFLTPTSGAGAGVYTQLGFGNTPGSASVYGGIRTAFTNPAATSSVSMQFWTDSGSSTYAERMRITQSGGVSIGTATDPGATNLLVQGQIYTNSLAATGVLYMGAGGLISTFVNELCFNASTGCLGVDQGTPTVPIHVGTLAQAMPSGADIACRNSIAAGAGFCTKPNSYGAFSGHAFSIDFTGSAQLWMDYSNLGTITTVSDYRIKRNIITQTEMALPRVNALRPVIYNLKNIDMFRDDGDTYEGFIAHEVQAIIPSGASGKKDDLNSNGGIQPQSLNLGPIVAVLTKAIQELSAKFDAYVAEHP